MNEHDEYWQKEFQSLSEEDNDPIQMKRRKYSTTLLLVWSIFFVGLVTLSVISSLLSRQGIFYWSPSIIIQGLSFYGTVYVLLAILYKLEGKNGKVPEMA
ncbi:MAG: hypothetical protein P1Q69_13660 [Candidatus Thorarchaeota archaeon]|nr:hypothetical protein [Candidatus Thorarchaeota archaeon]